MPVKVKDNRPIEFFMRLVNVSPSNKTAKFVLSADDGKSVGNMILDYRQLIDQSQKMGSDGEIKFPKEHHFPDRFVIKMKRPEGQ